jgi:hypothetical protein
MSNLVWHDYLVLVSFVACVVGLLLLADVKRSKSDDIEETDYMLLLMTFTYWLVYCLAVGIQKTGIPQWDTLLLSLRLTAAISYLLTFSCILSLPLHRFALRHAE